MKKEDFVMKRQRGTLRTKANSAKQRLGCGFWKTARTDQVFNIKHQVSREDEEFYIRIKSLLDVGVVNPLSQLLDREMLEFLSPREREHHIFTLSQKIRDATRRYHTEMRNELAI